MLTLAACTNGGEDGASERRQNSTLVFVSDRDSPPPENEGFLEGFVRLDLYAIPADGAGEPRRLTSSVGPEFAPACSPDGTKIAFTSAGADVRLELMKLDGSGRHVLARGEPLAHASWSPSGEELAAAHARDDGSSELYIVPLDGRRGRSVLTGRTNDSWPSWSPRGDLIAFLRSRGPEDPDQALYVTDPRGSRTRRLAEEADGGHLAWSPDGSEIAFARTVNGEARIWVVDVETRRIRRLTHGELENPQSQPTWSSDGHTIAFAETAGIATVASDGSRYAQLPLEPSLFMSGGESRGWVTYSDPTWCG